MESSRLLGAFDESQVKAFGKNESVRKSRWNDFNLSPPVFSQSGGIPTAGLGSAKKWKHAEMPGRGEAGLRGALFSSPGRDDDTRASSFNLSGAACPPSLAAFYPRHLGDSGHDWLVHVSIPPSRDSYRNLEEFG